MTDPISNTSSNPNTAPVYPAAAVASAPAHAAAQARVPQQADLESIAAALNQRAQDLQTSLHFQVDHVTGQLVISVIDTQDNRVLMQAPSQEALAIAQSLERLQMQLMKQSA